MSNSKYTNGDYQNAVGQLVSREVIACASTLVYELASKAEYFPDYEDDLYQAFYCAPDYEEAAHDAGWCEHNGEYFQVSDDAQLYLSVNLQERGQLSVSVHLLEYPGQGANGKELWCYNGTEDDASNLDGSETLNITDVGDMQEYLATLRLCDIPESFELSDDENGLFSTTGSFVDSWESLCECEDIDIDDYHAEIFEHWIVSDWFARKLEDYGQLILRNFFGFTIWGRATTGQAISLDRVICDIYDDIQSQAAA